MRRKRSSSAAAISSPSFTRQAAESAWNALRPRMYVMRSALRPGRAACKVALDQQHGQDDVGRRALQGIVPARPAVEDETTAEQAIEEHQRRPQHARQANSVAP